MARLIFHIDVNSAFLSWEATRRVGLGEDDIRLIPSAIGGDREKRTGVILAKSIPAKKYGIKTGEPVASALRKCPDLFLARPDFKLYEASSHAFISIVKEFAPVVEQVSIDECYADFSGTHRIYPDPIALAHTIKDKIRNELGFTVNVGIGDCKLLAKMASDFEKPDKVHTLFRSEIPHKMWPLPVGDLFTVGAATADKLRHAKIMTIGDLARTDVARVQRIVGQKLGAQIHAYANGIDPSPVLAEPEEVKGYSISTTLEDDVVKAEQAHKVLLALSDSVTARIRADGAKAYCVAVSIRDNSFKTRSHQRSLMDATDISKEVYQISKQLFSELWDGHTPLRLLGIALTNITREDTSQMSLFPDENRDRARKLDKAFDAINKKFGTATIQRGTSLQSKLEVGKKYQAQIEQKKEILIMSKKLVAYFSASGVTAKVADILADALGADLYEIRPEVPYIKEDLNWMDKNSRSTIEMNDKTIRPAIADKNAGVENYDTIFIGFPIWWYVAPTIINTFLESYDFSGKKVILFATSGGSGFGKTVEELKTSAPESCEIIEGKLLNGKQTLATIRTWTETLK